MRLNWNETNPFHHHSARALLAEFKICFEYKAEACFLFQSGSRAVTPLKKEKKFWIFFTSNVSEKICKESSLKRKAFLRLDEYFPITDDFQF